MPAAARIRTRTEAVACAIEAARAALTDHIATAEAESDALLRAQRELARASSLLRHQPRPKVAISSNSQVDPSASSGRDDLTRIRGIDCKAVERLAALGITSFEQIAAWEPADVRAIGQALDLGRSFLNNGVADQARMLLSPYETESDSSAVDAVATWYPRRTPVSEAGTPKPKQPLSDADVAHLRNSLRTGPRKTALSSLAAIAPGIVPPVEVPVDLVELDEEAAWQPSPLLETATPVVPEPVADETPVIEPPAIEPVAEIEGVAASLPLDTELERVAPTHVVALGRIAVIDAEISALGTKAVATDVNPQPNAEPIRQAPSAKKPQTPRRPGLPPSQPMVVEEAEITISARSRRSGSMLQPMSELPLRPKQVRIELFDPTAESVEVSEAAVVIVKRRARERAAPELEFYKRNETGERVEGELAS